MLTKKTAVLIFLLFSITAFTQTNFSYTPQNPKAGDAITITYEPSGNIAGTLKPVEAVYYMLGYAQYGYKNLAADDLPLKREGNKFVTTLQTDTASHFIYLGFYSDKKFDNNFNNGYYIVLNDGDKPRRGAYNALATFYQFNGRNVGLDANNEKALEALQKEMELYPADKRNYISNYVRLLTGIKKTEAAAFVQKEIETLLKTGLTSEDDYQTLENLYSCAKLTEQAKLIASLKKEKFPQGKWTMNNFMQKFYIESDPQKVAAMAEEIAAKIKTDPNWKDLEPYVESYKQQPLNLYSNKKDWDGFKQALATAHFKTDAEKASLYNNAAWEMQTTNADLKTAEGLSRFATEWAKKEVMKPSVIKPPYITTKQWEEQRKGTYAMYADTYAMVMYRLGEYKKGLPYAKEAALTIRDGKSADENNTYALLAEKVLPAKQFKKELEALVKHGNVTSETKGLLKNLYVKERGSEDGFEDYVKTLGKEQYLKMLEELKKSMLDKTAPSFALLDLDGNKINIADLKGKVVVADFWATWCGPCKASFPAMQKMVARYKDNPDVKFVFVDTWERVEDKKKNAADFISNNKYTFHVLLDNENKVVEQFNIEGIPTKFVIDKNGIIRFRSIGFSGNDDELVDELTAMIDIATQQTSGAKTF